MQDKPERWEPSLFGKQKDILNTPYKFTLASGSRYAAKTHACLHAIAKHLWVNPFGNVAVFGKSVKQAKDAGSWSILTDYIIQEWIEANIGTRDGSDVFRFTSKKGDGTYGVKTDTNTRTAYFTIRNWHGLESQCKLYSVSNDNEIMEKTKNKQFTMVFFIELSQFRDQRIFPATMATLRPAPHEQYGELAKYCKFQWLADTNPCETLGTAHWIYQLFYVRRNNPVLAAEEDAKKAGVDFEEIKQQYLDAYSNMTVVEMHHEDNPHCSDMQRAELRMSTIDDEMMYNSHYRGVWSDSGQKKQKLFADVFSQKEGGHVIGGMEDETSQIAVNPSSTTLITGWDLGKVYHASVIVDKWYRPVVKLDKDGNKYTEEQSCFSVLDEHVVLDEKITYTEFTVDFMEKLEDIERANGKRYLLQNWADDSATNVHNPATGTYDCMEVESASNGRIELDGVPKPDGSIRIRVRYLRRLLAEERIFISYKCENIIRMLENAKKGNPGAKDEFFSTQGNHKHIFDALTYILIMELSEEFQMQPQTSKRSFPPRRIVTI